MVKKINDYFNNREPTKIEDLICERDFKDLITDAINMALTAWEQDFAQEIEARYVVYGMSAYITGALLTKLQEIANK